MSTKYSLLVFFFLSLLLAACGGEQPKQPIQPSLTLELAQTILSVDTDSVTLSGNFKNARGAVSLQYSPNQGQPYDTAFQGQDFSFNVYGLQNGENTIVVTARDELDKTSVATAKVTYTPKQTFINATGTWSAFLQSPCDASQTLEFWLTFQDTGASSVGGNFAIKMPSKLDIIGSFAGEKDKNSLTGTLAYVDSSSNEYTMSLATELVSVANAEATLSGDFLCGTAKTAISAIFTFAKNLEDDTFEPNDDFLNGWPPEIPLEQELNLMMLPYDKDWFSLTLTEAQYVSFTLNKNLDFHFQGNSQFSTPREMNGTYIYSGFLEPGPSMFYVNSRDKTAYTLKVEVSLGDAVYEPNETWKKAARLSLPIQATFYLDYNDVDWFSLTLDQDSLIAFNVLGPSQDANLAFRYEIFRNGSALYADMIGQHSFVLPKGTYQIEIYRRYPSFGAFFYDFNIAATVLPDAALEPNNTQAQATPLAFGEQKEVFIYTGETAAITGWDHDWFVFSVERPQIVDFDLGTSEQIDYVLYKLVNNQLERIEDSHNTLGLSLDLQPGTYYLVTRLLYEGEDNLILTHPVQITSRDVPDIALEPNDTLEAAILGESGKPYSLYLMTGYFATTESDFLRFDISTPSLLTFQFEGPISGYQVVNWREVNGVPQMVYTFYDAYRDLNGKSLRLESGRYYFEFKSNLGHYKLPLVTVTAHIEGTP